MCEIVITELKYNSRWIKAYVAVECIILIVGCHVSVSVTPGLSSSLY